MALFVCTVIYKTHGEYGALEQASKSTLFFNTLHMSPVVVACESRGLVVGSPHRLRGRISH